MAIKEALFAELRNAVENNGGILPSEVELSAKLGISRTQIRDYLAIYENERLIVRQRRKGTKVIKDVLDIPLRMDFDIPYKERFKAMGYSSAYDMYDYENIAAEGLIAEKLGIAQGSPAIRLTSRTRADGHVAIYTQEYLSYRIIKDYDLPPLDGIDDEIFVFLRKYCGTEIDFVLSELNPAVADDEDARIFEVEKGTPYQVLEEVAYNKEGERILWTVEKYLPQYLRYTIVRKKSLNSLA